MVKISLQQKVAKKTAAMVVADIFVLTTAVFSVASIGGLYIGLVGMSYSSYYSNSNTNTSYSNTNTYTSNYNVNTNTAAASAVCGNGVVESGEECDDGNLRNGDGCSSICLIEGGGVPFLRGDANGDGKVDISDAVYTFNNLHILENIHRNSLQSAVDRSLFSCLDRFDADDNGRIDARDALYTLSYAYLGGSPPPAPGPNTAGIDPTPDNLHCNCTDSSCISDEPGGATFAAIVPEGGGGGVAPACNDGIDNDGDGMCDFMQNENDRCVVNGVEYPPDPDCVNPTWDTEEPFLQPKRVIPHHPNFAPYLFELTYADIDGDDQQEFVSINPTTGCVQALDFEGNDKFARAGSSDQYCDYTSNGSPGFLTHSEPIVTDLDGRGGEEIIAFHSAGGSQRDPIEMYNSDYLDILDSQSGRRVCSYDPSVRGDGGEVREYVPIVGYIPADINGDGVQEIVVFVNRNTPFSENPQAGEQLVHVDVIEPLNCQKIVSSISTGFPIFGEYPEFFAANLDNDKRLDVLANFTYVMVKFSLPSGSQELTQEVLYVDPKTSVEDLDPYTRIASIADLDGDGRHEFVVLEPKDPIGDGGWSEEVRLRAVKYTGRELSSDELQAARLPQLESGISVKTIEVMWESESLQGNIYKNNRVITADMENNGSKEVLFLDAERFIHIYNGNITGGRSVFPAKKIDLGNGDVYRNPLRTIYDFLVADLNGDGFREIIVTGEIEKWSENIGRTVRSKVVRVFSRFGELMGEIGDSLFWDFSTPLFLVGDLDGNGQQDILMRVNDYDLFLAEVNPIFSDNRPDDPFPWKTTAGNYSNWNAPNTCQVDSDCSYVRSCGSYSCVNYECVRDYAGCDAEDRGEAFIRGDVNNDGKIQITDVINLANHLFNKSALPEPFKSAGGLTCEDAMDTNDDGFVDIGDVVNLVYHLFNQQAGDYIPIPPPNNIPGFDPTQDSLTPCSWPE